MDPGIIAGLSDLICITGIPGTGKTTICRMLNEAGISCEGLNRLAENSGALEGDTVDVDILSRVEIKSAVVEAHYSHLLNCSHVIILVDNEEILRKRMEMRGYTENKIDENLDAQRAGIIYYEALERLPAGRIHILEERSRNIEEVYRDVISIISMINEKS